MFEFSTDEVVSRARGRIVCAGDGRSGYDAKVCGTRVTIPSPYDFCIHYTSPVLTGAQGAATWIAKSDS